MHILAQHGFNAGERINRGLAEGLIDGVIYGAKDIAPERLSEQCALHASEHPESLRLFDPQYYACLASAEPGVRLGHLSGRTPHSYFAPRLRRQLEQEHQVIADIGVCLRYQCALPVSALVVPNVVIRHSLDSVDASIAKEFVRQARGQQTAIGDSRPLYATLAISIDAIRDRIRLQNFLQEVTEIEDPPDGFYVFHVVLGPGQKTASLAACFCLA